MNEDLICDRGAAPGIVKLAMFAASAALIGVGAAGMTYERQLFDDPVTSK